jgi:uncharacterized protein with HEPN domain
MRNNIIIQKLIEYIQKIETYCGQCVSYQAFTENKMIIEACVFNLSQMGELANRLDDEFIAMHSDVPWKEIYNLRNKIVHDYEGINFLLIWQIIKMENMPLKSETFQASLVLFPDQNSRPGYGKQDEQSSD